MDVCGGVVACNSDCFVDVVVYSSWCFYSFCCFMGRIPHLILALLDKWGGGLSCRFAQCIN